MGLVGRRAINDLQYTFRFVVCYLYFLVYRNCKWREAGNRDLIASEQFKEAEK